MGIAPLTDVRLERMSLEQWAALPEDEPGEIHELDAQGRYVHVVDATGGIVESVPRCERLTIDIDALWGEVAALAEEEDHG